MDARNIASGGVSAGVSAAKIVAQTIGESVISWKWTKRFLHWLILNAGECADAVFLISSIWMTINASVHPLVLKFISEDQSQLIGQYATSAYVVLPELIVGLAIVTTINHIRMFSYSKDKVEIAWIILYGGPTIVFLALTLYTLAASVAVATSGTHMDFTLPLPLVEARAIAGYTFALTSLLYTFIGRPTEVNRLRKKDALLKEKEEDNAGLNEEMERLKEEFEEDKEAIKREYNALIADIKMQNANLIREKSEVLKQKTEMLNEVNTLNKTALQAYPEDFINRLKSSDKTISLKDIVENTGFNKAKIQKLIDNKTLHTAPNNKSLIRTGDVLNWLKVTPPPTIKERDTDPIPSVTIK